MEIQQPFFLVWKLGGSAPTFQHDTYEAAVKEAERLAHLNRGQTFVVMVSRCARVSTDLREIDYDDVPF